jgi:hypothetical protein
MPEQNLQEWESEFLNGDWIDELIELGNLLNAISVINQHYIDLSIPYLSFKLKSKSK